MKQLQQIISIGMSAWFVSSVIPAHAAYKDEAILPIATASYNWTGFYAGLNVGAMRRTMNITDANATSFNATLQQSSNPDFTGGFQVGYRYQLNPDKTSGIMGVEFSGNFSYASFNEDYGSPFALYQLNAHSELKNVYLLQLIGGIAADKTLLFLAGGLSVSNITGNVRNLDSPAFFNSFSVSKQALGTSLGAGVEYAINDKISARLKVDLIAPNAYSSTDNVGDIFQISNSIAQGTLGINYKFG
jgi:outer membrane immunogenic protein